MASQDARFALFRLRIANVRRGVARPQLWAESPLPAAQAYCRASLPLAKFGVATLLCLQYINSSHFYRCGGTITHHHAVGRDHMPWYRTQRPALFGKALAAAKRALDPAGIMNPGVLVP